MGEEAGNPTSKWMSMRKDARGLMGGFALLSVASRHSPCPCPARGGLSVSVSVISHLPCGRLPLIDARARCQGPSEGHQEGEEEKCRNRPTVASRGSGVAWKPLTTGTYSAQRGKSIGPGK